MGWMKDRNAIPPPYMWVPVCESSCTRVCECVCVCVHMHIYIYKYKYIQVEHPLIQSVPSLATF